MDASDVRTPGIVNAARRSHLWDGVRDNDDQVDALDDRTRAILATLDDARMDDCDRIVEALRDGRTSFEVYPLYGAVGDAAIVRQMPSFIRGGEWVLDGIIAWADANAVANVNLQLTLDSFPFPMALVAPKADVLARSPLRIPVNEHDQLRLALAGTALDRVACLLVFARLS